MMTEASMEPNFCDCGLVIPDPEKSRCGVCEAELNGTFRAAVDQIRGKAYEGPTRAPLRGGDSRHGRSIKEAS